MAQGADEKLARKAAGGDAEAFVEMVRRHREPLMALIGRMVPDRHHREDVLQETLLQAWRALPDLSDASRLRAWLVAIARNRCRDYLRSPKRRERATEASHLEIYVNRTGRAVRHVPAREDELGEMLAYLGPVHRQTVELFYIGTLTVAQVAQQLKCSPGTVRSRLFHARRALRRFLEHPGERKDRNR